MLRLTKTALTFAISVAMVATSPAIIRRDGVPDADFLALGAQFPAVGRLDFTSADRRTGTLLGERHILTAAHNWPGNATTPLAFQIGGETYTASNWIRHPSWNSSNFTNGFDIMLGRLDRRVMNVKPMTLFQGTNEFNKEGVFVGFGATGTGTAGQTGNDFQKRAATNWIEYYTAWARCLAFDFDDGTTANNVFGSLTSSPATPTALEGHFGNGDSGGPLLTLVNGEYQICGVASFRGRFDANTNSTIYGSICGFSRIFPVLNWTLQRLREEGTIQGEIKLGDFLFSPLNFNVTFRLFDAGTENLRETQVIPLSSWGGFTYSTSLRGNFDLRVQFSHWLSHRFRSLNITTTGVTGLSTTLVNGDVDKDNSVTIFDYIQLSVAFDTSIGDSSFNANADLDGDDSVTIFDYIILSANFDKEGS